MDLIFFDLDGTLLNKSSKLSSFTTDTLRLLKEKNIAHTLATGRTMLSAQQIVGNYDFELPHIYNNGVTVWDPKKNALTLSNLLAHSEISAIIEYSLSMGITPFINALVSGKHTQEHVIFHSPTRHQVEKDLVDKYFSRTHAALLPLESFSAEHDVTNISMIGDESAILPMWEYFNGFENLVAYSGVATEGHQFRWMDVHHRHANKGTAVNNLKSQLGATNVICFGDSDNDLSMFALADESYAPSNANEAIKKSASEVIGHHHQDGVAHFLRERFSL